MRNIWQSWSRHPSLDSATPLLPSSAALFGAHVPEADDRAAQVCNVLTPFLCCNCAASCFHKAKLRGGLAQPVESAFRADTAAASVDATFSHQLQSLLAISLPRWLTATLVGLSLVESYVIATGMSSLLAYAINAKPRHVGLLQFSTSFHEHY